MKCSKKRAVDSLEYFESLIFSYYGSTGYGISQSIRFDYGYVASNSFRYKGGFSYGEYHSRDWEVSVNVGDNSYRCSPEVEIEVDVDENGEEYDRYYGSVTLLRSGAVVWSSSRSECGDSDQECISTIKSKGYMDQCYPKALDKHSYSELKSFPGTCKQRWNHTDDEGILHECPLPD